ncbi:GNVR domain-containing protein [Methylococcus sp. EFPC2]|uniref:GumC family protein n=1 Tax=Methylococcus sp. EFPC2 TaxID=2812648 RepID=UPI001967AE22|nr:GNVR domain-containing protein [Methylococcus sp. EFPC2]QSA97588.1 lipopolysaccharide biosynthesis protein [Methylococcus sp. EFPC2]
MEEKDFQDYIAAFKRNKAQFTLIFGGVIGFSLLIALFWPATYRSSATILIEEQEIPTELVKSTITTYAAQRLQMINQRVMTRANLEKIIEKFDLYADERKKSPTEEVIEKMRKDLDFEPISAEVIDPRTGQPSKATIAFSLAYDGRNPELVQQVANEITSLYLEENLKSRTQKTAETSDFLSEEATQMSEYVAQVERKLADFKEQHIHNLPEQKDLNLQFMDRTERDINEVDTQLRSLEERKLYLEGQLAQIQPESPIASSTGERIMSSVDRLKALQTEYLSLSSKYSDKHPDVVKMRQEIEALTRETGGGDSSVDQVKQLTQLRGELASLSDKYAANHPDVIKLNKQIKALEDSIARQETGRKARKVAAAQPDNPAYITLQAQRDSITQDIAALGKKRLELKAKLADYEKRLSETPDVERQYLSLVRDYENASAKYRELKAKEMEAQIAQQLEKKSKGERFSIIEPPLLPEKPVKPNRLAIAFLGLVLAIASGSGYVLLRETLDKSVRGLKGVVALTGVPPLAVIPLFETDVEVDEQKRRRFVAILVGTGVLVAAVLLVHLLWTPLDVLWFRLLRKLDA